MRSRPIGTPLSESEAATVVRFEMAPDADESLRERIARSLHGRHVEIVGAPIVGLTSSEGPLSLYSAREIADAAIAVMRGDDA